jgi:7,8-dihydropterin-6-yl-methyl-4-(beta-D-ribofuranosyl)aminobenzene 5'-phosphate synthase
MFALRAENGTVSGAGDSVDSVYALRCNTAPGMGDELRPPVCSLFPTNPAGVAMKSKVLPCLLALAIIFCPAFSHAQIANRVTILYDAFGKAPSVIKDWGFSALVEYSGKRILFDTGNNAETFAHNVKALGVDLKKLDFVVISHRHADHTSGLNYLLSVNPDVRIYTPDEPFGSFARGVPNSFYRKDDSLPAEMRYFDGKPPEMLVAGSPWPGAHFVPVNTTTEVTSGLFLVPTISQTPGTLELRELSLAVKTPSGLILVDGCSHAGVEKILEAASAVDPHVHLLFGGLHLVKAPDPEVDRIALALRDQWKLDAIAPGHCTGEPEFTALKKTFGGKYIYAGVGTVVDLH